MSYQDEIKIVIKKRTSSYTIHITTYKNNTKTGSYRCNDDEMTAFDNWMREFLQLEREH